MLVKLAADRGGSNLGGVGLGDATMSRLRRLRVAP